MTFYVILLLGNKIVRNCSKIEQYIIRYLTLCFTKQEFPQQGKLKRMAWIHYKLLHSFPSMPVYMCNIKIFTDANVMQNRKFIYGQDWSRRSVNFHIIVSFSTQNLQRSPYQVLQLTEEISILTNVCICK